MNEYEPLDLSALSTEEDLARWQAVMDATMHRVDGLMGRRPGDPLTLIASWTQPLLTAAAVSLALLVPLELALEMREPHSEQVQRLVSLSTDWTGRDAPPSGTEFRRALAEESRP